MSKGKLFITKLFFEEFNLIFFTAESAWPVLKCNQGSDVLENFEVNFLHCGQGNYVVKRNLMYIQMFHIRFNSFWYRCLKKNFKMCPDWRWRDFVLKFAVYSADFFNTCVNGTTI